MTPDSPDGKPLVFTRQFDRRVRVTAAVVFLSTLMLISLTLYTAWPTRIRQGYKPSQPIAFSHQLHAGSLEIRCRYCHAGVDRSSSADIPPLSTCMNCHGMFKPDRTKKGQAERLQPLYASWNRKEPVVWNKVYDLSDFVYFPHDRHMAKAVDCSNCHGQIETMPVVKKVSPLTMGWCLKCHMAHEGYQLSEDAYLYGKKGAQIVDDPIYRKILALIYCSTCHR